MLLPDVVTLDRLIRFGESTLTITGSSLILPISFGSIIAISISNLLLQSRLSSTFSSMCTKAMIASPCSLELAMMKSSSTSILATFLLAKAFGVSSISSCTVPFPMWSDSRSTFLASSISLGIKMVSRLCRRLYSKLQNMILFSPPFSRPIRSIQSWQTMFFIRTFLPNLCQITKHAMEA
jgi:hypothetical protein